MLVKETFRVFDSLPRRCAAESIHQSVELWSLCQSLWGAKFLPWYIMDFVQLENLPSGNYCCSRMSKLYWADILSAGSYWTTYWRPGLDINIESWHLELAHEACQARNLDLYWTSNQLRHVGLEAMALAARRPTRDFKTGLGFELGFELTDVLAPRRVMIEPEFQNPSPIIL